MIKKRKYIMCSYVCMCGVNFEDSCWNTFFSVITGSKTQNLRPVSMQPCPNSSAFHLLNSSVPSRGRSTLDQQAQLRVFQISTHWAGSACKKEPLRCKNLIFSANYDTTGETDEGGSHYVSLLRMKRKKQTKYGEEHFHFSC